LGRKGKGKEEEAGRAEKKWAGGPGREIKLEKGKEKEKVKEKGIFLYPENKNKS
jgi:hypothetical protein